MAVDYDLIVVGPTSAAQTAAIAAAQTYARVAWITETSPRSTDPLTLLRESTRSLSLLTGLDAPQLQDWAEWLTILETALDRDPAANVQAYSVNYLEGSIQFQVEGSLSVRVGKKVLRSRSYLLAMDPEGSFPSIPGIERSQVWTITKLWNQLKETCGNWPKHLTILGHGPQAVELSQALLRLGIKVLILTGGRSLLPQEDPEIAELLQVYLEGSGISINTREALTEVLPLGEKQLLLQLSECKVETEGLIIAMEESSSLPSYLIPLHLNRTKQGLWVNSTLQTSSPNIYACGPILGGYRVPGIASCEARLAIQNALFEERSLIQYHQIPYAILSDPPLARVGLTEQQAQRYDPKVQVIRQTYKDCDRALFEQAPTGLCKVLVQSDGQLLGAHIIGTCAQELIHVFALAIQQGCSLQTLGRLGYGSPTFTQVIQQVAEQWRNQGWNQQRDYNERWFYNRRKQA
jgi:pyruvate/2-oxoglutarate dehydrogenase complex dihydrolipoamide dehydrogenase (E3) component